jgi:hypothetical protein
MGFIYNTHVPRGITIKTISLKANKNYKNIIRVLKIIKII